MDSAILDYFEGDLNISLHFAFLRQFLLMEDGEFSQRLADELFDRVANSKFGENSGGRRRKETWIKVEKWLFEG